MDKKNAWNDDRPSYLCIHLEALSHNLHAIQQYLRQHQSTAHIMGIIKANAYGHGLVECAQLFQQAGINALGVAFVEEGILLRQQGIHIPILVLGGIADQQIGDFIDYDLDLTASSLHKMNAINECAAHKNKKARIHLKIDTGMQRIGVQYKNSTPFFESALRMNHCHIAGVFSHLATSEELDQSFANVQIERFIESVDFFNQRSLPMPTRHIANSGAILQLQNSWLDMVRPGLILYGVSPASHLSNIIHLQPALSLHGSVSYFKVVPAHQSISYGRRYTTIQDTRIVTIPIGYGDGLLRSLSQKIEVIIRGQRYPQVGQICMDQMMINLGPQGEAYNGDPVVLIGKSGDHHVRVEDWAHAANTVAHEILTALNMRLPRHYMTSHKHHIHLENYNLLQQQAKQTPEDFWHKQAQIVDWIKPFTKVKNTSFYPPIKIRWYEDGILNASSNCLDRHLSAHANKTAIIWQGENPNHQINISYAMLHEQVCRLANVFRQLGIKKGDVVTLYLPMIKEAAYAMLACARIGAVHSVVFAGFSAESIKSRMQDSKSNYLITSNISIRAGQMIPLQAQAEQALQSLPQAQLLVFQNTHLSQEPIQSPAIDLTQAMAQASSFCEPEPMNAEDPLFILYTSGSTGKPKGILHTTGGYLVYTALTFKQVFDYQTDDIYWCSADIGWITGHSYMIYGPLLNAATTVMYEGSPTFPDPARVWQIVDQHQVSIFYTAPTLIRTLMGQGDDYVYSTHRQSLRLLGSVGEPINPEAWRWYHRVVGHGRCPIVDTYWQTETGGFLIAPYPFVSPQKPGSATKPCLGITPVLVDEHNQELSTQEQSGYLCINDSWPGQMRGIVGDHARFYETYFKPFLGRYFTGDGAKRDHEGDYFITGRVDDVLNVSGHRIGTAEIESACVLHPQVAEAAAVGYDHPIKGQGIYCFVTLKANYTPSDVIKTEIIQQVAKQIGALAKPDYIQFTQVLPKTRSGKIMRRILRLIANQKFDHLGDIQTLQDPDIIQTLIAQRLKIKI